MCSLAVMWTESPRDWAQDLVWRMSRATPEHTVRGLNFTGSLEMVRELAGEDAVRRCLEVGGEERFVDFFSYPARSLLKVVYFTTGLLGPMLGGGEAVLRRLGRQSTMAFLGSPLGRTAVALAHGSVRRMVEMTPDIYRQTMGAGSLKVGWTGPRSGLLVRRGDLMPAVAHEAALEELLRAAGGKRVQVWQAWEDGMDGALAFSWE